MNRFRFSHGVLAVALVLGLARLMLAQEHSEASPTATAAADHGAEAGHAATPNPMAFSPDLAVFSFIVFLLLVMILGKFAWPAISQALDERERHIADNISAAEARHEDAKRLLAEHEAKLAAAAGEVRALLEEARRDADVTKRRIEEEGRKAATEEIARATREIQRAKEGAIQELAVASANTAIELARKVVREKLTGDQQSQLVREALGKLAATTPSKN